MTPMLSPLLALQKAIAKAKGAYGAQRVEKAADLVPNLEKMYQMEALERAFGGDNAKALIVMPPEQFEEFARPIFVGDPVHRKMMEDNVKSLQKLRQGFADVPFLEVGHKPGQLPFISGHEGRHRSRALQKRGEESSLVNVFPKYREDFPRRTQEEFIEEMRRQLGESRLVTPEGKLRATPENPEGAIEFPEIFREGGAVHMKDGSTDKVRQLIEEAKGTSGRYDPMRAQRVSEYEKGFRDYLAAQQEARESLFKPSPTVGGMAKGAAGALAGYAAQVPGAVGDVLSLYDEFKPERAPNLPEWARALPTTERLQEYYLPENASPELQAGVTGGNLFALGQGVAALPKVVAGGARMAGRGAQALAPTANQMLENYMLKTGQMLPLNVYHGSPHRFAPTPKNPLGEFDPTKIGTGEGAQSYGHGHYLAENPNVANNYRNMLSGTIVKDFEGKIIETGFHNDTARAATFLAENGGDFGKAIKKINDSYPGFAEPVLKKLEYLRNAGAHVEKGSLYKVDLPDEQIAKMLDWDKPLSEQPEGVQKVLKDLAERDAKMYGEGGGLDYYMGDPESYSGESVYRYLTEQLSGQPEVSSFLKEAGIPGVKYFDAASRDAGEGTRNFVVFPGGESMLNIISREKKGGMVSEDAMRMKSWDKHIQRKAKGGEIKASPTYPGQEFLGQLGRVAERLGITAAEAMKIVSEQGNSPIKAFLGQLLIADPLKSAGTALQDWTGTPREITPEHPYSRLISGKGMTTRIDPRVLDVATFGQPVASRLTSAATGLPQAVKEAAIAAYGPAATASHVVKPKGGNWLTGSVEDALMSSNPKRRYREGKIPTVEELQADPEELKRQLYLTGLGSDPKPTFDRVTRDSALSSWIDKQLTRYVKNEMGTPEDPVRALAERGVLHYGPENVPEGNRYLDLGKAAGHRMAYFPVEGSAKSDLAKFWEHSSDARIVPNRSKILQELAGLESGKSFKEKNPWLEKLDPNTPVYKLTQDIDNTGFDHLIDELRNATNPDSGLPRELLLKPESLSKLSVPQAVERVAKINAWRAAQKAEADLARARNPATALHKEYPEGYGWYQLKTPAISADALPEGYELRTLKNNQGGDYFSLRDMNNSGLEIGAGLTPEAALKDAGSRIDVHKHLEDALKYEGEQMGHCVGGYCPDVAEGRSQIFSLRDKKGQPHVTIEVAPNNLIPDFKDVDKYMKEATEKAKQLPNGYTDRDIRDIATDLAMKAMPPSIRQIKGKANRAPKPEYLPFVQDFVRSGKWGEVGDVSNTGLIRLYPQSDLAKKMKSAGVEVPSWITQEEMTQLMKQYKLGTHGMKRGGLASNDDTIRMAVWNKQLRKQHG